MNDSESGTGKQTPQLPAAISSFAEFQSYDRPLIHHLLSLMTGKMSSDRVLLIH